ncbi:MAG: SpaH/EbpB family LPXTG-anchored major pilin, partial [Lachnospiraceae bacterium]|nr:SpaH/EbpB family LPXTG-anchored major pilin [Lachnospiraceae bacterium]
MKKFWSRMAALGLAAVLALGTANVPVGATQPTSGTALIDSSEDCSLIITKYDQTEYEKQESYTSLEDNFIADGEQDTEAENALGNYALKNVKFGILKVAKIYTYSDGGTVKLGYNIPNALVNILGITDPDFTVDGVNYYTSSTINAALATALADDVSTTATKNALEAWYQTYIANHTDAVHAEGYTGDDGQVTFDINHENQGLYLVVELEVPEDVYSTTNPFFVSLPMTNSEGTSWLYDVYVYPKNQTNDPTIDKQVKDDDSTAAYADYVTASEGDVLDYQIVVKMPTISSSATYLDKLVVEDEQSAGLTYNQDSFQIYWYTADNYLNGGESIYFWNMSSAKFSVSFSEDNQTAIITVTGNGLKQVNEFVEGQATTTLSDCYMVIKYTSTLDSNAEVVLGDNGNDNTATLTYSRTNTDENSIEDIAKVFTYGISGQFSGDQTAETADKFKYFTDSTGSESTTANPGDAIFILYNYTDQYYVPVTKSAEGVYYVTDNTSSYSASVSTFTDDIIADLKASSIYDSITFSPASNSSGDERGRLRVEGLEADTYILIEVETANGYSLLRDPITIVIDSTDVTI